MPETMRISAKWTVSIPSLSCLSNWIPEFCKNQASPSIFAVRRNLQKFNTVLCVHVLRQVELEIKLKKDSSQKEAQTTAIGSSYLPCANPLRGATLLVEEGEAKLDDFQKVNIAPQELQKVKQKINVSPI